MSVDGYLRYLTIGSSTYEVLPPIASSDSLGGIKVGSGLSITNDGTLSTTGGGTVTSVGLTNGTNGGLSISGSPITSSGSITVGHSNVLSSAQTTSAVYPIKIDKNGHISEYGSAVSIPTKVSDLTNDSGFITGMTILSYGNSTWQNFIDAYNANKVVYCRASSNSNPASGSQTRLAFMAYVNNATTPTEVEFQYYRSVSTHTASQQGDQVYVYKLNKTNGWTVTIREASVKVVAGTGLGGAYSNGTMTLTGPTKVSDLTNDSGFITTETDPTVPSWAKESTKPSYNFSEIGSTPTTLSGYGITDASISSGVITLGSNTITPLTSSSTLSASKLSGAIPSAVTATTQSASDNSTKIATTAYVTTAIANLPEPMIFKGSVGTNGTITSLPAAAAANEGFTYKVITALSTPVTAKVGDTVISNGSEWVVIPSGDEPSGTVTSVGLSNATNGGLTISGSPITSSGSITVGHSNVLTSAQTTQAVYPIKIDKNGHISAYGNAVTIPTVNNATLTIQKNGTTVNSFTANASSNVTANITVPTKVSELTNDSGYITNAGVTGVKGNSESSYRTGQVNLTAANIGAIPANSNGNTQNLYRPIYLNGLNDNTLDQKISTLRANRLAFLPADQIIIEKTTDGGTTWVDAEVTDDIKLGLFSETRNSVYIPLLNGVKDKKCGIRITFTAMKYNVPSGTAETNKYNYWNSTYVVSQERYNQLKEMYFWVNANSDTIGVKLERATGAASTTWNTIFNDDNFCMTGWSGNDYIRFSQGVFGGGTNQTTNYWNYRLTFMTKGTSASYGDTMSTSSTTQAQSIMEIRGYGDIWWGSGNNYAAEDKIYTHDKYQNVIFPGNITPKVNNSASLGSSSYKWANIYATTFTGNLTGTASGNLTSSSTLDATKLSGTIPSNCYTDTNTTYTLSNALSSHKFTSTLTAGGSGSGTSTATMELVAGTGITLTDDTTNKKITIASSVTNTDEKLKVTNDAVDNTEYYPIFGSSSTSAETKKIDSSGFKFTTYNGTRSVTGSSILYLGNNTASGTAGNKIGYIKLYGSTQYSYTITGGALHPLANRTLTLPDKSGTIALTNDIPDVSGKIDTAGTGLSKSGTTLNHSNSVTAQTTQAVYPIKIDAQGHISGYGTAVTIPTVPSKLSDLTNDLIYDLGTVTVNAGVFSVSADDVTAITALWNDGYCALKLTINSIDYYAYKERVITYSGLSFMGFVAVEADINASVIVTGKNLVGINSGGVGMFAFVKDLDNDDVQTTVNNLIGGKQDTLVSGTNIKTINNQSLLGSGNISVISSGTSVPTANETAEFDSSAKMNSTNMTSSEVTDFVESLDISGGGGGSVPTFNTATITLTTAGWSNNSQTVTVQGVTASNIVIVNPAPASYDEYVVDNVRCTGQSANSLTFTCDFVPDEAITVSVIITSVTAVYGGEVS